MRSQGVGCTPWRSSGSAFLDGNRGTICIAKGSDACPGIPRAPCFLRGRCGTMRTAKGSDVRPGVPRAPHFLRGRRGIIRAAKGGPMYALMSLGLRIFSVAGVGQCTLPRGRMSRPGIPRAPRFLRDRRGTV